MKTSARLRPSAFLLPWLLLFLALPLTATAQTPVIVNSTGDVGEYTSQAIAISKPGTFSFGPENLSAAPPLTFTRGFSPGPSTLTLDDFEAQTPMSDIGTSDRTTS